MSRRTPIEDEFLWATNTSLCTLRQLAEKKGTSRKLLQHQQRLCLRMLLATADVHTSPMEHVLLNLVRRQALGQIPGHATAVPGIERSPRFQAVLDALVSSWSGQVLGSPA